MKRFSTLPITLYRLQNTTKTLFRSRFEQEKKNKVPYDFTPGEDNLYHPTIGDKYLGPNGLSLRPLGVNLADIVDRFGNLRNVFELDKDLVLPENLVLILEHGDHYSLQTTVPIEPELFCKKVEELLKKQKKMPKSELLDKISSHLKK